MTLVKLRPTSAGTRHQIRRGGGMSADAPRSLRKINKKSSGRNSSGKITTRHRGGRQKRFLREIDFKRVWRDIPARVESVQYDPNRSASIALVIYRNGVKSYILAPDGLAVGREVLASDKAEIEVGNALPLARIPIGTPIHNIEMKAGKGGQLVRSAGTAAYIQAKEDQVITLKMPSGEVRQLPSTCWATVGQVSNADHRHLKIGKAGRKRLMGWRPTVRGVAQNPRSHPHGGGEGRTGIGMKSPKSPWGKRTLGKKTRKRAKYSNKHIIKDRRNKR